MIKTEIIVQFADRGNAKAIALLQELQLFEANVAELEAQVNSQINQIVQDITHVISRTDTISARDTKIPLRLVALADAWGKVIDPSFSAISSPSNTDTQVVS